MKIGIGYDIHRLVKGRKLFLGGVRVPSKKGLLGHSDADVILHAVCDALLGAMGTGDIGLLFPNTDRKYKNISSLVLLKRVAGLLKKNSFRVGNIDVMLLLEAPEIGRYRETMKAHISKALGIGISQVSLKATTNEGTGDIGKGKACAAYAVVLIKKEKP
ncbi:MAG: 2-C-methyl-D-erythritol 2,4-cyclodiphosphate synthase [Candidatus Omnitrophota bacterium]